MNPEVGVSYRPFESKLELPIFRINTNNCKLQKTDIRSLKITLLIFLFIGNFFKN